MAGGGAMLSNGCERHAAVCVTRRLVLELPLHIYVVTLCSLLFMDGKRQACFNWLNRYMFPLPVGRFLHKWAAERKMVSHPFAHNWGSGTSRIIS
jgi:hypothetical protein